MKQILIASGANTRGQWGAPPSALARAVVELRRAGVRILAHSPVYGTAPVGRTGQPDFVNAVFAVATGLPPRRLLRLLKRLEVRAGRRPGLRNGPRPLDLDIVDYAGHVTGWQSRGRRPGALILPHPEAHRRAFVLLPLLDVAPHWVHPAMRVSGCRLLDRLSRGIGDMAPSS